VVAHLKSRGAMDVRIYVQNVPWRKATQVS